MSKIYQGGQAEKRYQGNARDASFNPTTVTNNNKAIREAGQQKLDNLRTEDRERKRGEQLSNLERQYQDRVDTSTLRIAQQEMTDQLNLENTIDKSVLQLSQTVEKGNLALEQLGDKNKLGYAQMLEKDTLKLQDMQEKAELGFEARAVQANNALESTRLAGAQRVDNANRAVGQAIIQGLVDFATTGIEVASKANEERRKEAEELAEFDWLWSDEGSAASAGPDIAETNQSQQASMAFETGVQRVSPDSAVGRENIRQPAADVVMSRNFETRDITMASMTFQSDLSAVMNDPNTRVMINGVPRTISSLNATEYADATMQVARQLTREYGLTGKNKHDLKMSYGRAVKESVNNQIYSATAGIQSRAQSTRAFAGLDAAAGLIGDGRAQDAYDTLFNSYRTSGKYDKMGNAELTEVVLKDLLSVTPPEQRELLYDVVKDRSSNTKFGDPGNFKYGELITDSINDSYKKEFDAAKTRTQVNVFEAKKTYQEAAMALSMANSPEEALEIRQRAIAELQTRGPEAIELITKLENGGNMRATPAVFMGMMDELANGDSQTAQERLDALADGSITKDQYDQLERRAKTTDSIEQTKKEAGLSDAKKDIESIVASAAVAQSTGQLNLTDAKNATGSIAEVIYQRYDREMNNFIRRMGDDVDPKAILIESARLKAEIRNELNGSAGKANDGHIIVNGTDVKYINWSEAKEPIVRISPITGREQAVYDNNEVSAISNDASLDDIFYTRNAYLKEVRVLQAGGQGYSQRTLDLAKKFNTTPKALLERQADALGYERDALERVSFDLVTAAEQPTSLTQGQNSLMAMGFTADGAAYLAGNIQQESSWNGQREPWDDQGAPAGGLVSWRADRLTKIEGYLGKPISQATNAEQLMAMKWEMQKDYPASYRIFTNPNSTPAQLERASKAYWGWGEEGDRFRYAESLINGKSVSLGGTGSLTSFRSQIAGPGSITFESDISRGGQPGMDIFFEDHQFPAVLSGLVKESGYQVDANGRGYGNFLVVESVDPATGQPVDVLYGHLAEAPRFSAGDQITTGQIIGQQGGTGSVSSVDGTIASIDFLAPAPAGTGSMTPYSNYKGLRAAIARQLGY